MHRVNELIQPTMHKVKRPNNAQNREKQTNTKNARSQSILTANATDDSQSEAKTIPMYKANQSYGQQCTK